MSVVQDKATEVLLNLVTKAANGLDAAVAFSKEQIPDVVAQLLMWNLISSALLCLLGVILIVTPFLILKWGFCQHLNKKEWAYNERRDGRTDIFEGFITLSVIGGIISLVTGVIVAFNNFDWLQILVAPKLYLLEYAASLIKG